MCTYPVTEEKGPCRLRAPMFENYGGKEPAAHGASSPPSGEAGRRQVSPCSHQTLLHAIARLPLRSSPPDP
ncbi:unnamed protein product [Boreogadus saida]